MEEEVTYWRAKSKTINLQSWPFAKSTTSLRDWLLRLDKVAAALGARLTVEHYSQM